MRLTTLAFIVLLLFLGINIPVSAQNWYYPTDYYFERQGLKGFGQLIDDDFYKGKEARFPFNKFYGYHAAVDLEYLSQEEKKDIPVYAITNGAIKYIGELDGYGGVILQDIGDDKTALYGHVKTDNLPYNVGQEIRAGQVVTYFGDEFSRETSKERKHLHFGIYKGTNLYFKGHEISQDALERRWENPTIYLKEKGAIEPNSQQEKASKKVEAKSNTEQKLNSWDTLIAWVKTLLGY